VLFLNREPVITIDYSARDHLRGDISFHHLTVGYGIEIRPADTE
jgi:hypothetical protein